ncbi:MAG: hypothetical protein AAF715_32540 [Myxococcota bacterium]
MTPPLCTPLTYEDWQPDEGIPPGYVPSTRVNTTRLVGGVVTTGAIWVFTGLAALGLDEGSATAPLFVPVVGPFIAIHTLEVENSLEISTLLLSGLGQVTGLGLFLSAFFAPDEVLVRRATPAAPPPGLTFSPQFGPDRAGLSFDAVF